MEMQENIAYEIAMLVKENRELKLEVDELKDRCSMYQRENERLRELIRKKKTKAIKKVEEKEMRLYDVPGEDDEDIAKFNKVVIVEASAKNQKFPNGFVLYVKHISKNESGIVTITGKYNEYYKSWSCAKLSYTKINNKFYKWMPTNADLSTLMHGAMWDDISFKNLIDV